MDIGSKKDARPSNRRKVAAVAIPLLEGGGNSNAKDGKRRSLRRGRSGWAAVQTPGGAEIGSQKCGRSTQDDGTAPDYRHLRNNFSPNAGAFRSDAVRLARLRHRHRTHGLDTWMIHGRVMVSHSRHAVERLSAVAPTFRSSAAFAHECADPGRSDLGEQDRQENYRSCGSSHFRKLYLTLYETRKPARELSSIGVPSSEPRESGRGLVEVVLLLSQSMV